MKILNSSKADSTIEQILAYLKELNLIQDFGNVRMDVKGIYFNIKPIFPVCYLTFNVIV